MVRPEARFPDKVSLTTQANTSVAHALSGAAGMNRDRKSVPFWSIVLLKQKGAVGVSGTGRI